MARRLFPRLTDDINKALGNITDAFQNAVQNMSDAARAAAGQVVARTDEVTLYENSTSSVSIKPQDNDIGRNVKLIDADKGDLNGVVTHNTNSIYASLRLYSGSYDYLDEGETETAEATYTIQAANGKTDTGIIRVTIVGFNDSHWGAGGHETFSEDDPVISIDLLDHFYDPEGHAMSVDVTDIVVSGPVDGLSTSLNGSILTIDNPEFLNDLKSGQFSDIAISYTVSSKGFTTEETAQITVAGEDDVVPFTLTNLHVEVPEGTDPAIDFGIMFETAPDNYGIVITGGDDLFSFSSAVTTAPKPPYVDFRSPLDYERPGDFNGDNIYEIEIAVQQGDEISESIPVTIEVVDAPYSGPPNLKFSYIGSEVLVEDIGVVSFDLRNQLIDYEDDPQLSFNIDDAMVLNATPDFGPTLSLGSGFENFALDYTLVGSVLSIDTAQFAHLENFDLGQIDIDLTVTDGTGVSRSGAFLIAVLGDSEPGPPAPPSLSFDTVSVSHEENVAGVEGFGLWVQDGDLASLPHSIVLPSDGTAELAIVGGADADLFRLPSIYYGSDFVVGEVGTIVFDEAPDFENPMDADGDNIYEVEVAAIDAFTQSDPVTLYIQVTDVIDETPAI